MFQENLVSVQDHTESWLLSLYSTLHFVMRPNDNPAVKIEGEGSAALSIHCKDRAFLSNFDVVPYPNEYNPINVRYSLVTTSGLSSSRSSLGTPVLLFLSRSSLGTAPSSLSLL